MTDQLPDDALRDAGADDAGASDDRLPDDRLPDDRLPNGGSEPYRPPSAGRPPREERRRLTHVDRSGRPRMVDVSGKATTARRAVAEAFVTLSPDTLSLVIDGRNEKGDVLGVAEIAGVM